MPFPGVLTTDELVSKYFLIVARPKLFDDEALLESMRETFLELGPGASTQELAKRARVSEGTLFKRFDSKRKMFMQALRLPELDQCSWFTEIPERAGKGSLEEHLAVIAIGLNRYAGELMPCAQMIAANGKLRPQDIVKLLGVEDEPPPFVMIARIKGLFEKEMALGRMRETDPEGLARMFIGAVMHNVHVRLHFPDSIPDDDAVAIRIARTVADLALVHDTDSSAVHVRPNTIAKKKTRGRA